MLSALLSQIVAAGSKRIGDAREARIAQDIDGILAAQRTGNLSAALRMAEKLVARHPSHAGARQLLGSLCGQGGDLEGALAHLRAALDINPRSVDALVDLGNVHRLRDEPAEAIACYRQALGVDSQSVAAHTNLGLVLKDNDDVDGAVVHLRKAVEFSPHPVEQLQYLSLALISKECFPEALEVLSDPRLDPDDPQVHACKGFAFQKMHDPERALVHYEEALKSETPVAELVNIGMVMQDLGRIDEALDFNGRALALQPDFPGARFHRATACLLIGDFGRGWPDYDARLMSREHRVTPAVAPRWQGEALDGRTILVRNEQGLGDEIMFSSCIPDLVQRAGRCMLECNSRLEPIFRRSFPGVSVFGANAARDVPEDLRAAGIDFEVPTGSLPAHFRHTPESFPAHRGYLSADASMVAEWGGRLRELGSGVKVGISWQGGSKKTRRPMRSLPLEEWMPILSNPGVRFVSLQYGEAVDELTALRARHGVHIEHWQEAIDDYDQTAALVSSLDLVISVCTAAIHLGGALGRPVWVMAPYSPEWRYGLKGASMVWYPSVRMFRQDSFGAWPGVVSRVADALQGVVRT
jgi:tetratricopeptide (TPR) repeat protein